MCAGLLIGLIAHNVLFTNVYVKEHNFRNHRRQEKRNIEPTHATLKEVYSIAKSKGLSIEEVKDGLNELYLAGEIEVGRTINDKWIKINTNETNT